MIVTTSVGIAEGLIGTKGVALANGVTVADGVEVSVALVTDSD